MKESMPDYWAIYHTQGETYERLISCEDYQEQLPAALARICPPDGLDVVELGAGTGRLTRRIASVARTVVACDISPHMLGVARAQLTQSSQRRCQLVVADHRALPAADRMADLVIEGWSLGHFTHWYPDTWRREIGQVLTEIERVMRPGGTVVFVETLGTGQAHPSPPSDALAAFYNWLVVTHGFSSTWIRTDYRFASLVEAEELVGFFFDAELAARVRREALTVLPECTGLWWRTYD
jgi:ubiquinone/menaquinone biosynthesis C-methylase UbiE